MCLLHIHYQKSSQFASLTPFLSLLSREEIRLCFRVLFMISRPEAIYGIGLGYHTSS
jgi:hypothetical protein